MANHLTRRTRQMGSAVVHLQVIYPPELLALPHLPDVCIRKHAEATTELLEDVVAPELVRDLGLGSLHPANFNLIRAIRERGVVQNPRRQGCHLDRGRPLARPPRLTPAREVRP